MGIGWMALIFFGGTILFFFCLGRFTEGSGADLLDWNPSKRMDDKRTVDDEDLAQMLERSNARRRAAGKPELSEYEVVESLRRSEEDT